MQLTRSVQLLREDHIVTPLDVPKTLDHFSFTTAVRFTAAGEFNQPQWLVWTVPNPDGAYNAWQYTLRTDPQIARGMDSVMEMVGLPHEIANAGAPAMCMAMATLDDVMRGVEWDAVGDLSSCFDEHVQFLKAKYGKHHMFVLVRVDRPGNYVFAFEWCGTCPFVTCTTLKEQAAHPVTALVFNAHRLEWTRPGVYGSEPPRQNTCVDRHAMQTVAGTRTAVLICLVYVVVAASRRNSDLVAPRMDWGDLTRATRSRVDPVVCRLM